MSATRPPRRDGRLAAAAGLNALVVLAQVVFGLVAGSLGLLADAGHNLADTLAIVLALVALRLSRRGPSTQRTFGGLRWPVLAAQANATTLLLVTLFLTVESIRRIVHPHHVDGGVVLVVALLAAAANGLGAVIVHERHGDLNTRAAVLHLGSDAAVSLAVAAAGAVIWIVGGAYWLDPAVSLLVGLLVGWQGIRLLRESSSVLLEATPAGLDVEELRRRVAALPEVAGVHDLHVWSLSDRMHAASVHVCIRGNPTLTQARLSSDAVKALLQHDFGIDHATVELETELAGPACTPDAEACGLPTGRPESSALASRG